ncbi:MAG: hypothetical protein ABIQ02_03905 [Saprospiraceae bacterium]
MESTDLILIFKTNVKSEPDQQRLATLFNSNPAINQWNVDSDDVDCVLRIVTREVKATDIIKLLTETGYQCQELE